MNVKNVYEAIEAGAVTNSEIADYLGLDPRHVGRETKKMVDAGDLERVREGNSYVHRLPAHAGSPDPNEQTTEVDRDGLMPVPERPYDFTSDEYLVTDAPQYVPQGDEWDETIATFRAREVTKDPVHVRLTGPTGCGKTVFAQSLARELADETDAWGDVPSVPFFAIGLSHTTNPADLLGMPLLDANGGSLWADGTFTKALMASREGPVVLLLDEVNRAPTSAKDELYGGLDHRASVKLEGGRGGELIQGNPLNLVVVSTMNEGYGHRVESLDMAERRRLGGKYSIDYLGMAYPEREADLVSERTPAGDRLAELLVETANAVRDLALDDSSEVRYGLPTSALLTWGSKAYAFDAGGFDEAVVRAGERYVADVYYDSDAARDEVVDTIRTHLDGCPFDAGASPEWADGDLARLSCVSCSWAAPEADADHDARVLGICPECGEMVDEL